MRRQYKPLIAFILLCSALSFGFQGCPKTPEEKATFKHNALAKVDTYANSVKLAQGVVEDLYDHSKISKEQASDLAFKLRTANRLGKQLGDKVKAIDPNASTLPTDLNSILDDIEQALANLGVGQSDLIKAIGDIIAIVNEMRGLIR